MKKAIKVHTAILVILILLLAYLATSCSSTKYIPVESVRTEYINKYLRDSVVRYDSVFVKEKGDSVWLEKYKYIYRDRFRTDTVMQTDTIKVPYPVKGDPIPYVTSFQSFQMWCGRILLVLLLLYFGYRLLRKYLPFS